MVGVLMAAGIDVARAQAPAYQVLAPVAAVEAQFEARVATLERAGDLPLPTVQQQVEQLGPYLDALSDASASYEPLRNLIPQMRVTYAAMQQSSIFGEILDVTDGANSLHTQLDDFRVILRNLQVGPYLTQ